MTNEKTSYFSLSIFFPTLICVVIAVTMVLYLCSLFIPFQSVSPLLTIVLVIYSFVVALLLTMLIRYNEVRLYENPMKRFAKATSQVAKGDFSVYVEPIHTLDKQDYLDLMIRDFNKMVEALGSVETLKTDFLSNVSHEIKTPLSVIQNYAQLLKQPELSNQQRLEYANAIQEMSNQLSQLMTNILKLNKLEKQTMPLNVQKFDLSRQLTDCILLYELLWEQKEIEIDMDLPDHLWIESDQELLEIVWNNLISNAIKFSEPKTTLHIKSYIKDAYCYVVIRDEGCGMDDKTKMHLFEKFYQGDTSHASQGNGLGLAMVSRIIELVNGQIEVESELNQGSTFTVRLLLEGKKAYEK